MQEADKVTSNKCADVNNIKCTEGQRNIGDSVNGNTST